ncbi:hypothetical protein J7E55_26225 [Bacillus sp. ISL-53]|nr:hypothetical protein [Bacillus sp. ISL-53]
MLLLRPEGASAFDQNGIDRSHPVTVFTRIGNIDPKNIKAIFEPIPIRNQIISGGSKAIPGVAYKADTNGSSTVLILPYHPMAIPSRIPLTTSKIK